MNKTTKCCVYIIKDQESSGIDITNTPTEYQEYFNNRPKFCDLGDDPSFYCSEKYNANVTWGVCRHNVRQGLNVDDEIHFVACDKTVPHLWKYYYVGYGIVKTTISHKDIWENHEFSIYQKYFNNLIKPAGNNFEHKELLPPVYWHDDWKMRICSERTFKKLSEIEEDIEHGICGVSSISHKKSDKISSKYPYGNNYIVFDKLQSHFNLESPGKVAEVKWTGKNLETVWINKSVQKYFSNGELKESFTHKGRQHPAFKLNIENAEKLKKYFSTKV